MRSATKKLRLEGVGIYLTLSKGIHFSNTIRTTIIIVQSLLAFFQLLMVSVGVMAHWSSLGVTAGKVPFMTQHAMGVVRLTFCWYIWPERVNI